MLIYIYIRTYKCIYSDFAYIPYCSSNVCGSEEDECWEYLNDEEYQSGNIH